MRYFMDCEFIERGCQYPIDLISIGIVAEDGREYYALNYDCDWNNASQWVKDNVLNQLPEKPLPCLYRTLEEFKNSVAGRQGWRNRDTIALEINLFVGNDKNPEFYGEWCSYDWVVFAQIFGTMMDLPQGFPMRCRDVIQIAEDELGIPSDDLPPSLETEGNHNALLGARTVKQRFDWLNQKKHEILRKLTVAGVDQ